ncbi:uncharacterized protein LOC126705239 [Quercus robur]|uniref:uncharacterized protein LOC126705239 n=1 Tax=Quercus robur TaxID=38942 RepID=UPI00216156E4|nr:uncharacterized protein LOC126705239 [Quercus robur]
MPAEEKAESSRLSLEEEIDEFYFEEEVDKAPVVELSDPEGEQDCNSVAGGPVIITCSDDSLDEEVGDMAGKGKSLRELMSSRGKGQSSKAPVPFDPGLKVNPDLKKKRPADVPEEGEVAPRPAKQQKATRGQRSKRANSTESRDEENRAEVRVNPRAWSPKMELDGVAIPYTASVREYNRGRAGYIAEALEQPVLLSRDIEAYKRFSQPELFLSLKRDLAMITQQVFVAEEFCRSNRSLAEAEVQSRAEVEKTVGFLKQEIFELTEKFKESEKQCKSAEVGLKSVETQAEDQCQKLYVTETSLATEKQNVLELKAALQKAGDETRRAKEEAQLIREAAEAEKKASHQLGIQETEARLSEEIPEEIRENPDGAQVASEQDLAVPDAVPVLDKAKDPAMDSISEAPPPQPEQKKDPPTKA